MNKNLSILLLLLVSLTISSCQKEDQEIVPLDYSNYAYAETQCADPWHSMEGTSEMSGEERVLAYFEAIDLEVINFDYNSPDTDMIVCFACSCPSGNSISLSATEAAAEALIEIGFTLID